MFGVPSADAREVASLTNHQLHRAARKVNIMSIKVLVHICAIWSVYFIIRWVVCLSMFKFIVKVKGNNNNLYSAYVKSNYRIQRVMQMNG